MDSKQGNGLSVLSFDGVRLAFPLAEVIGLQRSALLETENKPVPFALASIVHASRRWPVFALDKHLQPLPSVPEQDLYCVCLSTDNAESGIALLCERIDTVALATDVELVSIPSCIQQADSPLRHWHWHSEAVLPISSAPAIAAYISARLEPNHD